jgi:hypothetical protein
MLSKNFRVYPNPTTGIVTITFNKQAKSDMQIEVYSTTAQLFPVLVWQDEKSITLDISDYPVGIYIVRIIDQNEMQSVRICKE